MSKTAAWYDMEKWLAQATEGVSKRQTLEVGCGDIFCSLFCTI